MVTAKNSAVGKGQRSVLGGEGKVTCLRKKMWGLPVQQMRGERRNGLQEGRFQAREERHRHLYPPPSMWKEGTIGTGNRPPK